MGDRLDISWSQDQPDNNRHTRGPPSERIRYDGNLKDDILTAAGPTGPTGHDVSEAAPPVLTSYRDDPMWADLGLHVLTESELKTEELRRRIETNRDAAIKRKEARLLAEADRQ